MTLDQTKNFGKVVVSGVYTNGYQVTVNNATKLPDPASGQYNVVWYNDTDYPDPADDPNVEIVRVIGISGNILTLENNGTNRIAQEGTSVSNKNISGKSYKIILALTSKMISDIQSSINARAQSGDDISIFINDAGYQTAVDVTNYVDGLGYLTDAPIDGLIYGRNNGAWVEVSGGGSYTWTQDTDANGYSLNNLYSISHAPQTDLYINAQSDEFGDYKVIFNVDRVQFIGNGIDITGDIYKNGLPYCLVNPMNTDLHMAQFLIDSYDPNSSTAYPLNIHAGDDGVTSSLPLNLRGGVGNDGTYNHVGAITLNAPLGISDPYYGALGGNVLIGKSIENDDGTHKFQVDGEVTTYSRVNPLYGYNGNIGFISIGFVSGTLVPTGDFGEAYQIIPYWNSPLGIVYCDEFQAMPVGSATEDSDIVITWGDVNVVDIYDGIRIVRISDNSYVDLLNSDTGIQISPSTSWISGAVVTPTERYSYGASGLFNGDVSVIGGGLDVNGQTYLFSDGSASFANGLAGIQPDGSGYFANNYVSFDAGGSMTVATLNWIGGELNNYGIYAYGSSGSIQLLEFTGSNPSSPVYWFDESNGWMLTGSAANFGEVYSQYFNYDASGATYVGNNDGLYTPNQIIIINSGMWLGSNIFYMGGAGNTNKLITNNIVSPEEWDSLSAGDLFIGAMTTLRSANYSWFFDPSGNGKITGTMNLGAFTVASLPTGGPGDIAYVTDAIVTAWRGSVVGGGTETALVFYDAAIGWIYH